MTTIPLEKTTTGLMPLRNAVRLANRVAPQRTPLPIASHLLLRPRKGGGIDVVGTDLEMRIEVPAVGDIEKAITVPARLFNDMLQAIRSQDVLLRVEGRTLRIDTETLSLRLGGSNPDDFPPPPRMDDATDLPFDREAFIWTSKDCATDDSRRVLAGVAINPETGSMAASDGFRLRVAGEAWTGGPKEVILPRELGQRLPANCARVLVTSAHALIEGEFTLFVNRTQGTFPNYAQIIPKEHAWSIECDRQEWIRALLPLLPVLAEGSGIVRLFSESGGLCLLARAEELGEAKARLSSPFKGKPIIAVSGAYLLNALQNTGPSFVLHGTSKSEQMVFEYGSRVEVVMPMFVQWGEEGD